MKQFEVLLSVLECVFACVLKCWYVHFFVLKRILLDIFRRKLLEMFMFLISFPNLAKFDLPN